MDKAVKTRVEELRNIVATLLRDESLLVLGDPGAGKTAIAFATRTELKHLGYTVAVAGVGWTIRYRVGREVMTVNVFSSGDCNALLAEVAYEARGTLL